MGMPSSSGSGSSSNSRCSAGRMPAMYSTVLLASSAGTELMSCRPSASFKYGKFDTMLPDNLWQTTCDRPCTRNADFKGQWGTSGFGCMRRSELKLTLALAGGRCAPPPDVFCDARRTVSLHSLFQIFHSLWCILFATFLKKLTGSCQVTRGTRSDHFLREMADYIAH